LEFNAVAMPYLLRINGVALPIDPDGRVVLQPVVRSRLPACPPVIGLVLC
jgi:hypothetical protein